jgi:hypothetical protein
VQSLDAGRRLSVGPNQGTLMNLKVTLVAASLAPALMIGPALAIDVGQSTKVAVAPADAWAAITDFCSIADWHPAIVGCEQFEEDGKTMRRLELGDGGEIVEALTAHDDAAMTYSYVIVEGPLPVADYASTMSVTPSTDGAIIDWRGAFAAAGVTDSEATGLITGIYQSGLESLAEQLTN